MIQVAISRHIFPEISEDGLRRALALTIPALFIYLNILLFVTGGLYFVRLKVPHILGTAAFSAEQIVSLTNVKRAQNNLPTLSYNPLLSAAASAKASDMFANNYWAHNSPSGKTPWSFIAAAGYRYIFAGENLARDFDDPGAVVDAWMNSSSHRSNLLDKNFREIGVAVSAGKLDGREGILVVQMFGSGAPVPTQAVAEAPSVAGQTPLAQASAVPSPVLRESPIPTGAGSAVEISPTPTPAASPVQIAQESILTQGQVQLIGENATVLATRRFSIAKGVSFGLVGFIFSLFILEVLVTLRRAHVHLRAPVIAHLALLGFVLLAVWYAVNGAII